MRLAVLVALPVLAACATTPPATTATPLIGPEWRLEDLLGGGIIDRSHVTLTLAGDGRASGSAGCNGYFGSWSQAADGKLAPGQVWRQSSIIGSQFQASYEPGEHGEVIPTLRGRAHISGETTLILQDDDPFRWGIEPQS